MMADHADPDSVEAAFRQVSVKLPLRLSDEDVGVILDDDGVDVMTIDSNGFRSDDQALDIASMIVTAINCFAGFEEIEDETAQQEASRQ